MDKLFTSMCIASVTKQYNLAMASRQWFPTAEKVTAGLAESNVILPLGLRFSSGLTA